MLQSHKFPCFDMYSGVKSDSLKKKAILKNFILPGRFLVGKKHISSTDYMLRSFDPKAVDSLRKIPV